MKKRLTAAAMASILLLPAATMAEAQTGRAVAPENHSAPAVTQHHQQVNTGQLFTLTLPANPSTGYTWILRILPSQVSFVSSDYRQSDECKSGMTGCDGAQVFTFRAEKAGHGVIELIYSRPWEQVKNKIWMEQVKITDPTSH